MIRTGLIVHIAAETDTAEDHEVEDVLRDHEKNYERKIESQFQMRKRKVASVGTVLAYTVTGDIRQWEVYGNGRYTAVGGIRQ
jgi:hypothetical protein